MHVVIFAGGDLRPGRAVSTALAQADLIIGADRGAATAVDYGYHPSFLIGDMDSLSPTIRQSLIDKGSILLTSPVEKDETDTELAIQVALEQGATHITLLGALGGARFDHSIANILLLTGYPAGLLTLIDGPSRCWLLQGPGTTVITGQSTDLLSLFPLAGDALGVTTMNLYYPLHNATLTFGKPRGISNHLTQEQASVSLTRGTLLIIHTNKDEYTSLEYNNQG